MWFKRKRNKIEGEIVNYHFSDNIDFIEKEIKSTNLGLGYVNISTEKLRKSNQIKNSDIKKCINNYFKSEVNKLGFIGKDYKYIKEYNGFTAVINFIPLRYGGGTQVDLLVKVNDIKYPPDYKSFKSGQSLKYCEFSKRLAPLNIKVWIWPFEESELKNQEVLKDILGLINEKGLVYFSLFENLDKIVNEIDVSTFQNHNIGKLQDPITGFPSTSIDYYQGLMPSNYFVFEYARVHKNFTKAMEHAEYGLTQIGIMKEEKIHGPYHELYKKFINDNELK